MTLGAAGAALVAAAALAAPATAQAGTGTRSASRDGASPAAVAQRLERGGARVESLAPIPALVVESSRPRRLQATRGVRYVEPLRRRAPAFTPTDPLVPQQWYLNRVRAYDAWTALPPLAPVHVAVIDSGVDLGHPDLAGRIVAARSFVGGTAQDRSGHGTMIAGIIAAKADNGIGIAGLAPAAQLLVAKVVERDGTIPVEAEVRAIRWAVARGARVINMSLGGVRDPVESRERHVLAARSRRRGVRALPRRRRRGRRREQRSGAGRAVALCVLPCRAAPRHRRQRHRARRVGTRLLEP